MRQAVPLHVRADSPARRHFSWSPITACLKPELHDLSTAVGACA